jgi:polyphosphate kinase 2 (PPK2 family)
MQALEKENSKIELETAVLDNWKTEHHDDFVSVFGSADSSGESGEPIWLLLRA